MSVAGCHLHETSKLCKMCPWLQVPPPPLFQLLSWYSHFALPPGLQLVDKTKDLMVVQENSHSKGGLVRPERTQERSQEDWHAAEVQLKGVIPGSQTFTSSHRNGFSVNLLFLLPSLCCKNYILLPPCLLRAVSQGSLRCCLLGFSPHFTPNKT